MTLNSKTLTHNGRPLMAGDLRTGDEVEFVRETGEVVSIKRAERSDAATTEIQIRQDHPDRSR